MAPMTNKREPDFIRRAFRVLNVQTFVALIVIILLPYAVSFNILDSLFNDVYAIARGYSAFISGQFQQDPTPQHAQELAAKHHSMIGYEGATGFWYTDGTSIIPVNPDDQRPYYRGLSSRFDYDDGTRLVVTFPSDFFRGSTHIRLLLSWVATPFLFLIVLFFLLRRTLHPLRWMQQGIQQVTAGNLAFVAPTAGRESRNFLAHKFNAMTASMRNLIQSKDQLIMDLSHELRSPLTRIKVALALMPPDPNVAVVEKNVQNLEDILTTLLEAQRINLSSLEQKRENCSLAALIRESVELRQSQAPGVVLAGLDDTLQVSGDPGLLKLLIHNLLDNALKYSHAGSKAITVNLQRHENHAVLTVSDDGSGIPEDLLEKVFEPFFKVAPERGFNSGYGLGLSLCRRIVELHGGTIKLRNNPRSGLTASVTLPLTAAAL